MLVMDVRDGLCRGLFSDVDEHLGINNPNRINLPPPRPQWSLFSLYLIHILATGSAMRGDLFYWDGLFVIFKLKNHHDTDSVTIIKSPT